MNLKKKVLAVTALLVLLTTPASAAPLADTLTGFLDSLLKIPLTLAGLSTDSGSKDEPQPLEPTILEPPSSLTAEETAPEGTTEKGPTIDVGG